MTGAVTPDRIDLELLDILQEDISLVPRPWDAIAARVGISPEETISRVQKLWKAGIILSISPVLESWHLGIRAATLVAFRVPEEKVRDVAGVISSYREVSHNYRRDHPYGIWFTLSADNPCHLEQVLHEIQEKTGIADGDILNLPTVQKFKIDLRFPLSPRKSAEAAIHGQD